MIPFKPHVRRLALVSIGALACVVLVGFLIMHVFASPHQARAFSLPTAPASNGVIDPFVLMSPTLGGPLSAFDHAYGSAQNGGYEGTIQGIHRVALAPEWRTGDDLQPHAAALLISPSGDAEWDLATAARVVLALLPPDSVFVREAAVPTGTEHIFFSQKLGATFPASAFTTGRSQPAPSGIFAWSCSPAPDRVFIGYCLISIGQQ